MDSMAEASYSPDSDTGRHLPDHEHPQARALGSIIRVDDPQLVK